VAPEDWKTLVWLCETPHCGAEQLYKYHLHEYAKRTRPGLKVMLTGQGSDEFNGGYGRLLAGDGEMGWPGVLSAVDGMERGRLLRGCPSGLLPWEARFHRPPISRAFLRACAGERDGEAPWDAYTATKYRDLQMYNCWHEDRTAAGHGIENRVPFLDHHLVELVLTVPEEYQADLLWDKRILRDAMAGVLPVEICERPKGPFFYGSDERFTHRMMLRLLTEHNRALLEEAFSSGPALEVIDRDAIAEIVDRMIDDPSPDGVEALLRLVNMGLLDAMARGAAPSVQSVKASCALPSVSVDDWDRDRETIEVSLGVRREQIGLDAVLALSPSVSVLRREDAAAADKWYISVNNRIEYELPGREAAGWLRLLRHLDGHQTLRDALELAAVSEGEIRKYLEEALDFGIVAVHAVA
jgi:asparagine synthase (glutamine-hydrolysing)